MMILEILRCTLYQGGQLSMEKTGCLPDTAVTCQEDIPLLSHIEPLSFLFHPIIQHDKTPYLTALKPDKFICIVHLYKQVKKPSKSLSMEWLTQKGTRHSTGYRGIGVCISLLALILD